MQNEREWRSSENCAPDLVGSLDVLSEDSLGAHFSEMRIPPPPPRFYSPYGYTRVWRGNLPHWQQEGVAVFLTLRTADSLPKEAIQRLAELRDEWKASLPSPSDADERDFVRRQRAAMEKWLDGDHGSCPFRDEGSRRIVESALRHFDGVRYCLYAFVVMPNHLHLLLTPLMGERTEDVVASLKRFVSRQIGWNVREKGSLWQREYYDTLIRDEAHFMRTRNYIFRNNPQMAWDVYRRSSENCAPGSEVGVRFSELHHLELH